ncbi:MAG: 4a-hydroxytetrahydrobiopterin dehydratase [Fimbriimonadales bacterium]
MPKLTDEQLADSLAMLAGWEVEDGQITKTYEFGSYLSGVDFAVALANEAEDRDHHPDMTITWRKVKVSLSTHSEGGITEKDTELASFAEGL